MANGQSVPTQASTNAALSYWMAFALLRETPIDAAVTASLDRVANGGGPWNESALGPIVSANEPALEMLRRGAAMPDCDWGLDWAMGPRMPVAHLPKARVLGRLAALAGLRAAAQGHEATAVDTWLAALRFSRHVARGGSLISTLTGRAILLATLRTMTRAATVLRFDAAETRRIRSALADVPLGGFEWDAAVEREAQVMDVMLRDLAGRADPGAAYGALTGTAPGGFVLPNATQVQVYRQVMREIAMTFRVVPSAARGRLAVHEADRARLTPLLRDSIPSLGRLNDARAEIEREKQALLQVLAP